MSKKKQARLLAEDLRLNQEAAARIKTQADETYRAPGKQPRPMSHVVEGNEGHDFSPRLPSDPNAGHWYGFVLKEDRLGARYIPVVLPWEVVRAHAAVDLENPSNLNQWDTRVSQAMRIEREITSDAFTLKSGIWGRK